MTYVLYAQLTKDQSEVVVALHPGWAPEEFHRFEFWVTKSGVPSRKRGHHRLSEAAGLELDRQLAAIPSSKTSGPTVTKDQPRRYTGSPRMHLGSNED